MSTPAPDRSHDRVFALGALLVRDSEWATEDQRATAISVWGIHYHYPRPHTAAGDQPPGSGLKSCVINVLP